MPITLDKNGGGKLTIADVPRAASRKTCCWKPPTADPNGEVQTIRSTADSVACQRGCRHQDRGLGFQRTKDQVPARSPWTCPANPRAGVALEVKATARIAHHHPQAHGGRLLHLRQQNQRPKNWVACAPARAMPAACCCAKPRLNEAGQVELVVTAKDGSGNSIQAASSVYVTKQGRALVRWRQPRPHRPAAGEELPSRRDGQLPGAHALPLCHRAGCRGARRHCAHRGGASSTARTRPST